MDIFIEQLVKRKKTSKDALIIMGLILSFFVIIALAWILAIYVNPYFLMVGFFLLLGNCYVFWYFFTARNQEYEYIVTNNNLTIDRVIAKRKRKNVISIDLRKVEDMSQIKKREFNFKKYDKILYTGETEFGKEQYQLAVKTNKYGNTVIIFAPNQKVLDAMRPYLKATMVRENYL